ncbi:hypothetical protein JHK87_021494 [Glycine soja]|nr:hypothetical protein JHK87_021494 [Glycine soja]
MLIYKPNHQFSVYLNITLIQKIINISCNPEYLCIYYYKTAYHGELLCIQFPDHLKLVSILIFCIGLLHST